MLGLDLIRTTNDKRQYSSNIRIMSAKNIILYGTVVVLVLVSGFFFLKSKRGKVPERNSGAYKFVALEGGAAALVKLLRPTLNDNKDLAIPFSEVLDEHYKSLNGKKSELLFLAGYEQFVRPKGANAQRASFKLDKPLRPLSQVCNQYGVECSRADIIEFNPAQNEFLVLDGASIPLSKLEQKTVPLLGVKTEILNYVLHKIDESLRSRLLYVVSKAEKMTAQEFIEKKIITTEEVTAVAEKDLQRLFPNASPSERKQNIIGLRDRKRNEAIDVYLQKNVIDLPILVNIDQPQNDFKTRWEWTPYFGAKSGGATDVVLFVDLFSDASRAAIRDFLRYKDYNYGATFGIRPYFMKSDQLQWVAAEMMMCVWMKQSPVFWKYLSASLSAKRDSVEADLYKALSSVGGNVDVVKKCMFSREMQKVVEYHVQSAEYLKIINPPVTFVGNEVIIGPVAPADFEKMLLRQPR